MGWMWLDTELSSEVSVKASDNPSGGLLTTSLYVEFLGLRMGTKPGKRWLEFSVCHRWPAVVKDGLTPRVSQRQACWNTCWINATQKQDKGEKNAA